MKTVPAPHTLTAALIRAHCDLRALYQGTGTRSVALRENELCGFDAAWERANDPRAACPLRSSPPHRLSDEEIEQLALDCEQVPFDTTDPRPLAAAWRHIRNLVDEVIATRKGLVR